ncbi:hypothetical protein [Vibrio fluvialis]|uniref:hypothetical protein n=1 Tax=Vibrio fluvialis TaxID=676 RepID=UPI00155836E5|nr:hypothetical protein [Vibrio fluvialis]
MTTDNILFTAPFIAFPHKSSQAVFTINTVSDTSIVINAYQWVKSDLENFLKVYQKELEGLSYEFNLHV